MTHPRCASVTVRGVSQFSQGDYGKLSIVPPLKSSIKSAAHLENEHRISSLVVDEVFCFVCLLSQLWSHFAPSFLYWLSVHRH